MPFINSFERRGIRKGLEQGIEQGRKLGQLTVMEKLLAERFGPLPPTVLERLEAGSTPELEQWAVALLRAQNLEEVFRR